MFAQAEVGRRGKQAARAGGPAGWLLADPAHGGEGVNFQEQSATQPLALFGWPLAPNSTRKRI